MPDGRSHRGPHPEDGELFSPQAVPAIQRAVADLSWLLAQGYADKGALKLVGDRYSLTDRQRVAVMRSACSDPQRTSRQARCIPVTQLAGHSVAVDGYNLLITVEAALSGGVLLRGRDGCLRDLASIHGTYRRVAETLPAVELIGHFLAGQGVAEVLWLLDSPVSNSGRLKTLIRQTAEAQAWPWHVDLCMSPDAELAQTDRIVVSSDSVVLDACKVWVNLADPIVRERIPSARMIDLS